MTAWAPGTELDQRSDIFSFGVVLYELLSGRQAFRGENAILGIVAGEFDYDWREAERRFELALSRNPVPSQIRRLAGVAAQA